MVKYILCRFFNDFKTQEKLSIISFMTGSWVYPWFDVTNLFPYFSFKTQCHPNQFETSNHEWTRALFDLVLKKTTLRFEGCEKSTFDQKKNWNNSVWSLARVHWKKVFRVTVDYESYLFLLRCNQHRIPNWLSSKDFCPRESLTSPNVLLFASALVSS